MRDLRNFREILRNFVTRRLQFDQAVGFPSKYMQLRRDHLNEHKLDVIDLKNSSKAWKMALCGRMASALDFSTHGKV